MKKYKNYALFLILIFSLFTINVYAMPFNSKTEIVEDYFESETWNNGFEDYLQNKYGDNYKEQIDKNWESAELAEKIRNHFLMNIDGEYIYPNYIGGMYINDNNDLVLQIVKDNIPKIEDKEFNIYNTIINLSDKMIIEYVKHSYSELKEAQNRIDNYYKEKNSFKTYAIYNNKKVEKDSYKFDDGLETTSIDELENKLIIGLSNYDRKLMVQLDEIIKNPDIVKYEKTGKNVDEHYTGGLLPGNQTCSLGYRARDSSNTSVVGMMTAGHCSDTGGSIGTVIIGQDGQLFGTVWSWQKSGSIDAAFIFTAYGQSLSNKLRYNSSGNGVGPTLKTFVISSFTKGQWIGKVGMKTKYSTGTVISGSVSAGGLTNLVSANYNSAGGDSGGIVFGGSTSNYKTAGIHKGTYGNKVFSKASIINSTFGISRY